jgi:hypothetical protein
MQKYNSATTENFEAMKEAKIAFFEREFKKPYADIPLPHVTKKTLLDEIMGVIWSNHVIHISPGSENEERQELLSIRNDIKHTYKELDEGSLREKEMRTQEIEIAENFDPIRLSDALEVTEFLDISAIDNVSRDRMESLMLYSDLQKAMIERKAPSNEFFQKLYQFVKGHPEYNKNNLLHTACAERWRNPIIFLIDQLKEDVNSVNMQGMTPLMIAIKKGHIEIAKFLLQQSSINPNLKIKGNVNALHWCCAQGYDELVALLLANKETNVNAMVAPGYWPMFNNCQANPYTIALMNREFNIAELILEDKRFKPKSKNDLLMTLVTFYPDDELQLRHVAKLLNRSVDPKHVCNIKAFKIKKDALGLAKFLHLDHIVSLLENRLKY